MPFLSSAKTVGISIHSLVRGRTDDVVIVGEIYGYISIHSLVRGRTKTQLSTAQNV